MRRRIQAAWLIAAGLCTGAHAAQDAVTIDWASFLGKQDLVWSALPADWNTCPFIGNGDLGATIHLEGGGALGWELNQTDVTHGGTRYQMGRIGLEGAPASAGGEARLDLWNAEVTGVIHSQRGDIHWRTFASQNPSVIVIEYSGSRAENQTDLLWRPVLARPPGQSRKAGNFTPTSLNPPPIVSTGIGTVSSVQKFIGGGAYAVVLQRILSSGEHRVYVAAVGRGETDDSALVSAESAADAASKMGLTALVAEHRKWWHQFYPASFISIPDPRLEAFYWIQMYKMGSAMRADGPVLDLMGPWYRTSPWPHVGWDTDVELSYSPIFESNHLALGESLFGSLDRHRQDLISNLPQPLRADGAAIGRVSDQSLKSPVDLGKAQTDSDREVGALPWTMFVYWEYYRYQMDDAVLRDRVLPLLGRAIGNYLAILSKGDDGRYHLPKTFSPDLAAVPDSNYDLALLRWGLQTLISSTERLHINDPRLPKWREVFTHLAPLQTGPTGLLIGRGRPLAESHKHYSHLLAIYPLHLITPDRPADRRLIETSLHNWESRAQKMRGYSYTGAASISAELGDGASALADLHVLLDRFILPNTFYAEAGPLVDVPLSAATSVQEMLFQSWGGKLRIFPAIPTEWKDASFSTLRGEGAFLVSALRRGGHTEWVRVQSLAGAPCRLVVPDWTTVAIRSTSAPTQAQVAPAAAGEFIATLPKQAWIVLAPTTASPLPPMAPVSVPGSTANPYPQHYR